MFIPSSCCILVYKLVTSIETRIEFSGNKLVTDGHRLNLNEAPSYSYQKNDRYDLEIKVYKCDVEVEMAQFSNNNNKLYYRIEKGKKVKLYNIIY